MWYFIFAIAVVALTYALAPKPQNTPPVDFDQFNAPTAEEGRVIPVLFGCREITGANVVWYGDLGSTAIKSKGGKK